MSTQAKVVEANEAEIRGDVVGEKKLLTPEFRVSYMNVFEPRTPFGNEEKKYDASGNEIKRKPEYDIVAIFPPDTDMAPFIQMVKEAKFKKWGEGKAPSIRPPWRKGVEKTDENELGYDLEKNPEYRDCWIMTFRSKGRKPGVAGPDGKEYPDDATARKHLYSGCYARVTVKSYVYTEPKVGVTWSLQNIMVTRDGEPLGNSVASAEDDFGSAAKTEPKTSGAAANKMFEDSNPLGDL